MVDVFILMILVMFLIMAWAWVHDTSLKVILTFLFVFAIIRTVQEIIKTGVIIC